MGNPANSFEISPKFHVIYATIVRLRYFLRDFQISVVMLFLILRYFFFL